MFKAHRWLHRSTQGQMVALAFRSDSSLDIQVESRDKVFMFARKRIRAHHGAEAGPRKRETDKERATEGENVVCVCVRERERERGREREGWGAP